MLKLLKHMFVVIISVLLKSFLFYSNEYSETKRQRETLVENITIKKLKAKNGNIVLKYPIF